VELPVKNLSTMASDLFSVRMKKDACLPNTDLLTYNVS